MRADFEQIAGLALFVAMSATVFLGTLYGVLRMGGVL